MRRDEFMKELEYLLQDIPDEDKSDAIAYYRDYLDEAGPEHEEEVIRDFGSPERIAAIIRSDLSGNLEEGGEFTEKGYEDQRFREPNFQLVKRLDLPEEAGQNESGFEDAGKAAGAAGSAGMDGFSESIGSTGFAGSAGSRESSGSAGTYGSTGTYGSAGIYGSAGSGFSGDTGAFGASGTAGTSGSPRNGRTGRRRWEWWQILGMVLLGCCVVPIVIPLLLGVGGGVIGLAVGIGGGAIGILAGLGAALVSVTIALAAVTFALLLAGVLMIVLGIGHMANPAQGFLYLGVGVGILGLGFLCLSLCGLYYGKFLPWFGRTIIDSVSRLLHRKEARV